MLRKYKWDGLGRLKKVEAFEGTPPNHVVGGKYEWDYSRTGQVTKLEMTSGKGNEKVSYDTIFTYDKDGNQTEERISPDDRRINRTSDDRDCPCFQTFMDPNAEPRWPWWYI